MEPCCRTLALTFAASPPRTLTVTVYSGVTTTGWNTSGTSQTPTCCTSIAARPGSAEGSVDFKTA